MQSSESTPAALYGGTGKGLLEFLDYVGAKGILARKTAEAYKSASSLVLSIEGEGWENIEVLSLDIDQQLDRYIRLRGGRASPKTLATYRHRVSKAVELYRDFVNNPTGFRGPSPRSRHLGTIPRLPASSPAGKPANQISHKREAAAPNLTELVTYPFPLRSGGMAFLQLPRELTRSEVRRLCALLESLAIDAFAEADLAGREESSRA